MRSSWSDPEIEAALIATLQPVAVPAGASERMLASLPGQMPPIPFWRRRAVRYSLAVALAAIALIVGTNPQARDAVANTARKIFYLLPGQGIRGTSGESLVLGQPAELTRQGITLRVISVLADSNGTTLAYTVTGLPGGKDEKVGFPNDAPQPYLVDQHGRRYQLHMQSFGEGGSLVENHISGNLGFDPLRAGIRDVSLVIESPALAIPTRLVSGLGRWVLPLHLETPAEARLTPADMGSGGVTVNGITLHVDQVDRTTHAVIVHVSGHGTRSSGVNDIELAAPLTGDSLLSGSGRPGEWDLTVPADTTRVLVARVHETESGTASVRLNIPRDGSVALNTSVRLGRYRMVLTKEAWIRDENGSRLRVYFQAGPAVGGGRIESWELDGVNSYGFAWVDANGNDGYLELPDPRPGEITLHLKNPHVVIEGPWVLPLTTG